MARPLLRDTFARFCAVPSSITLFVCLGLPQVRDCHGRTQSAGEAGTAPLIVVLAIIALFPLAWRLRALRPSIVFIAGAACAVAVLSNILVLPIGIYCALRKPWRTDEMFVAFASACCAFVFLLALPLFTLFSTWLDGACVAWGAACVVLVSSWSWGSAVRARQWAEPEPQLEPEPVLESAVLAPPPAEPLPAAIGDYAIERELGAGGMARVYLGHHCHLETRHAIKVLDPAYRRVPEARQRFLDEAKIQAKLLDHPNIVKVTNIVATPDHAALVMDYIAGPSLETVLASLVGDPDEITRIMVGILAAVEHAHRAGVIHRDLKPGNVLLDGPDRIPRVTDFGIAKVTATSYVPSSATNRNARMGTLPYMSPEQLRGPQYVTPQSDVFSLGIVLYEMTTGHLPFRGESEYELMDAIMNGRYYLPPQIDPRIARVIKTALQTDPARRYASCAVMSIALSPDRR